MQKEQTHAVEGIQQRAMISITSTTPLPHMYNEEALDKQVLVRHRVRGSIANRLCCDKR